MSLLPPCLVLLAMVAAVLSRSTDYCYANDTNPYLYFASKTAYEFIIYKKKQSQIAEVIPHCEPVQIWLLSRHGTRYPGLYSFPKLRNLTYMRDQIIQNHETGTHDGRLCEYDLENLRVWKFNVPESEENALTFQGEEDLKFMALRLKQKFPTLLNQPYSSDQYQFRHTNTRRTKASAESFAKGLFGSSSAVYIPEAVENDTLIQSYENCTTWHTDVDDNPEATVETKLFQESQWVTLLLQNVSSRLGFRHTLKYKEIDAMYGMCRYDKAWKVNDRSPWCAVFNEDELKILEYMEDLKYYYKCGYGHDINVNLGCPPVKDFMDRFSKLESENLVKGQEPVGIFYFSHSSMLHMVQSRLGVFKDSEPLLHTNYASMRKRLWSVSKIGSFATNIAAVFFKCSEGDKNRVMFYASESPLDIDGCKVGLCSWDFVKEKFLKISQECNLDFCDPKRSGSEQIRSNSSCNGSDVENNY